MANCPNCGRSTARTKDWCCQWCGYPLFTGNFKTIDKTYKELKGDRLSREANVADEPDVPDDEPVQPVETIIEETIIEEADEPVRQEPVQRIIRRVRKVKPESSRPVRRVVRRRRPDPRSREEVEEIIEYIDDTPAEAEDTYETYVEESEYEDDYEEDVYDDDDAYEDDDYEEAEPRAREVRRAAPEPRPVRRERPEPQRPVRKNKILRRSEPQPEEPVESIEDDYEEEAFDDYDDEYEEVTDGEDAADTDDGYESEIMDEDDGFDDYDDDDDDGDKEDEDAYDETYSDYDDDDDDEYDERPAPVPVEDEDPDMELSVEDLVTAYETEGPDADLRYNRKVLRISGVISKVDVKEAMSVYALVLEAGDGNPMRQMLRCVFTRENGQELQTLMPGQNVIVQGKYDGSIINISMRDCRLVSILN